MHKILATLGIFLTGTLALAQNPPPPTLPIPKPAEPAPVDQTVGPGVIGPYLDMGPMPAMGRSWISADYLMWWFKNAPLPVPVVTTSNLADAGVLGGASTHVLFGDQTLSSGLQSGVQLNAGHWFNDAATLGIEASGFFFTARSVTDYAAHTGNPGQVLAVPYFSPTGGPSSFIISGTNPNTGSPMIGSINVGSTTSLWGAEVNGAVNLLRGEGFQFTALVGFRNVNLQEGLDMNYASQVPGAGPLYTATLQDQFGTNNQFYGGQFGIKTDWSRGIFVGSVVAKLAMGVDHETVNVNGQFSDPNGAFFSAWGAGPGGLLAQRSNIGSYSGNAFAVVPELQLRLGVKLTENLQLFVGYDFLFISNVVRPGDQIDSVVNASQAGPDPAGGGTLHALVGPARPMPLFNDSTFWSQGVNFGLQFTF